MGSEIAIWQTIDRLFDNPDAFLHFHDANKVTIVYVAGLSNRDSEVKFVVATVRHILSQIESNSACSQNWTRAAEVQRLVGGKNSDIERSLLKDWILGK